MAFLEQIHQMVWGPWTMVAFLGVGLFFINYPVGGVILSGDCVPAFPLWLAGGCRSCYHRTGQSEPFFAPVHHKLTASGQLGPRPAAA